MPKPSGNKPTTTVQQTGDKVNVKTTIETPNKPQWSCEVSSQPKKPEGFTVGEVFTLSCSGAQLTLQQPLSIKLPENFEYSLVLLKPLEMTDTKIAYEATSYRVQKLKLPFIDVVDKNGGGFISQPFELQTITVQEGPPPEKIFGGVAPFAMPWPMWLFFTAFVLVLAVMGVVAIFFKRRIQRANLEKNIRKYQSPMGSYHQFSKDIRQMRSKVIFSERHEWPTPQVQTYIKELDENFRMFLLREFIVPATSWSSRQTQKEIKSKTKESYPLVRDPLRKALQELDRAAGNYEHMKSRDCDQLTQIVVKAVDTIWVNKRRGKSA